MVTRRGSAISVGLMIGLTISLGFAQPVSAQPVDPGRLEYENQCSVCHGAKGRGDGPLASTLKSKVTDLTRLKKNNNGVMPSRAIFEIIEGKTFVQAHGPRKGGQAATGQREMPVWGKRLADQALFFLGANASEKAKQKFVRERINALIGYMGTLQKD